MNDLPGIPDGGVRGQRAARLRAETEAAKQAAHREPAATQDKVQWRPVSEGQGLEQIAAETGQTAQQIWNHPLNKQLRDRLENDPSGLAPGDALYIPTKQESQEKGTGPVGSGDYVVKEGDCISSIAKNTGHFWRTIWDDSGNSELREVRHDPNVLLPGDRVTVPPLRQKQEPGETERRHRFVRRGEPAIFRLRLVTAPRRLRREEGKRQEPKPRANLPYTIYFDGKLVVSAVTDAEGKLECPIPGNAREGKLVVEPGTPREKVYPIRLGRVPPITELRGVKARLSNLGLPCNDGSDELTDRLRAALRAFQTRHGLADTGEPDQATRDKLVEVHGS